MAGPLITGDYLMAQTLDVPLELDQDLSRDSFLPPLLFAPSVPDIAPFGFAPAPTIPAVRPVLTDLPALRIMPRRRFHFSWYESTVILLILSCAAPCIYRLLWAIQP